MKISVLIAANNAGAQIANTLASVRSQSHTEWEIIVVDYGPADATEETVRNFGFVARRAVHYEKLAETANVAQARNRLLELATGDAVSFLDPHDTWTQRHLGAAEQQLSAGADLVVSDIRFVDRKTGRTLTELAPPSQLFTNPIRALFARDVIGSISCVTFRPSLADRVGAFDDRFKACGARDFWLRCALSHSRFVASHRATCQRLKGGDNDRPRALLLAEHTVQFYEKYRDLAAVPAALRRRLLAASLVVHGRLLRTSDHAKAANCFWRAWSLQPVQVQTLGEFALTEWHTGRSAGPSVESPPASPVNDQSIQSDPRPAP
jgi:glycosyltransferase involved in cell wall biosynthesis